MRLGGQFLDIPVTLSFAMATPFRRDAPVLNHHPFRLHQRRGVSSKGRSDRLTSALLKTHKMCIRGWR